MEPTVKFIPAWRPLTDPPNIYVWVPRLRTPHQQYGMAAIVDNAPWCVRPMPGTASQYWSWRVEPVAAAKERLAGVFLDTQQEAEEVCANYNAIAAMTAMTEHPLNRLIWSQLNADEVKKIFEERGLEF